MHDDGVALVDEAVEHEQQLAHVLEVQTGRRLVEHVDAAAVRALLQLGRELDALRLAAGQGRGALAETHVAEPDVDERLEEPVDRADRLEELGRLADRHVEHLGDVLALVVHLERVAVVPRSPAHLARDVDVGQEVHLDLDRAVARAVLAATALDVEAEPAGLVAARLRLHRVGEQRADAVEDPGVGRRIRPRRASDRRLVDVHDLVELLEAGHPAVLARNLARAVELVGQHLVEDVVDEARLARTADPGDADERTEREADGHVLQVVRLRALDGDLALLVDLAALLRHLDLTAAGDVVAGDRALVVEQRLVGARVHDLAAVLARARTDVDDPVGGADGVFVVLDDDQRVAEVLQLDERVDEAPVVALVQADATARRARTARR